MKTDVVVLVWRMSPCRRRLMRVRQEVYMILLRLIGQPLLIVTGVVGRPWCKTCVFNGTKIVSASVGRLKGIYLAFIRMFAVVGGDGLDK